MLHSLVIGLGRAGHDLHLPVLLRARQLRPRLFAAAPFVAVDPYRTQPPYGPAASALRLLPGLAGARRLLDPEHTVVHVCTPPSGRPAVLEQVLALGFRTLLVEKPLAADPADLRRVTAMLTAAQARTIVVAPWSASALTDRLLDLAGVGPATIRGTSTISGTSTLRGTGTRPGTSPGSPGADPGAGGGPLGALRGISVVQNKPRFRRSLTAHGHPTAFDIELPHALGVLLTLAGDAEVVDASLTDLTAGSRTRPGLGAARMRLVHHSGVHSTLASDLDSPVRERRITLRFDHGTAVGHYAASADDEYAQLRVVRHGDDPRVPGPVREVFPDDSLTRFMLRTYKAFAAGDPLGPALHQHLRTVELLGDAKRLAFGGSQPPAPRPPADAATAGSASTPAAAAVPLAQGRKAADALRPA